MTQSADDVLKNAPLYTDEREYVFVHLPPNGITVAAGIVAQVGQPFTALIVDKNEVSLMLPEEDYEEFQGRLRDATREPHTYRLITFDVVLPSSLVGFMARVSDRLAQAGVSIMPFAAYSRDHIFVPTEMYEKAIRTLQTEANT